MEDTLNSIVLSLPFNAAYVGIARLSASGVANGMNFDIEAIEDIKVAISEVCNKLVSFFNSQNGFYNIEFHISKSKLMVKFRSLPEDKSKVSDFQLFDEENELGMAIINALMDEVDILNEDGYILSMTKDIEGKSTYDL